jgi:hypothetical protein
LAQTLGNGHGGPAGDGWRQPKRGAVDLSGLEPGNAPLSALGTPQRAGAMLHRREPSISDFAQALVLDTSEAIITNRRELRDER